MQRHQKSSLKETASLLRLVKAFVGEEGGFYSYSLTEGSCDAGDEDRYDLTFHEKGSLITFSRVWAFDDLIVPLRSKRFLSILEFLGRTDDQLCAKALSSLTQALARATRHGEGDWISGITVSHRRREDMHLM